MSQHSEKSWGMGASRRRLLKNRKEVCFSSAHTPQQAPRSLQHCPIMSMNSYIPDQRTLKKFMFSDITFEKLVLNKPRL